MRRHEAEYACSVDHRSQRGFCEGQAHTIIYPFLEQEAHNGLISPISGGCGGLGDTE